MDMNDMLSLDIEIYYDIKMNFMVGLCEQEPGGHQRWNS